ncbi:MAG TPA: hypothetical protein VFN49_00395 [Candidatus Aquilonibacter sp.]|nr:hypothetical protein [Candidatus Aquilonibacter sp.]
MMAFFVPVLMQIHSGPMGVNQFAGPHVEKTYSYTVAAKSTITVASSNGRISVKAGPAGKITVVVNRRAGTQAALAALGENVTQKDNAVTAQGTFPASCGDSCGSVDFIVTVPADASVVAQTKNGEIGVEGVNGSVVAATQHGPILCGNLGGNVKLASQNGMLNAGFRDLTHVSDIELGTQNGGVRLVVPQGAQIGTLSAGTQHGKIFSPLPLTIQPDGMGAKVDQRLSQHGPSVKMGTQNGDVNIVVVKS